MAKYDLEDRTLEFSQNVRSVFRNYDKNSAVYEDVKQVIRSSGSVGANYIEANEALTKKEFIYRINICRKESKESQYWLKLLLQGNPKLDNEISPLIQESLELRKIFGSILQKSK